MYYYRFINNRNMKRFYFDYKLIVFLLVTLLIE